MMLCSVCYAHYLFSTVAERMASERMRHGNNRPISLLRHLVVLTQTLDTRH